MVDYVATVHVDDLARAVPRHRHRIRAGTLILIPDRSDGNAQVAVTVKGSAAESHVITGLRGARRVSDLRIRWTGEGLRPAIGLRRAELERIGAIQVGVRVSLSERGRRY